jgi:hypothetical protein
LKWWRNCRQKFWVRALIVGVLLTGEAHLFTAEIFHHHSEIARACQTEHSGGRYLHANPDINPLCPICQIVRSSSVRPAVQSLIQKQDQEITYLATSQQARYTYSLSASFLARAPPLS